MSAEDAWLDIVRREAQAVVFALHNKSTLIATSYNPDDHTIKGILVPHGIESGWVRIGVAHAGNGYGIATGPKVGSADALDGDQFDIQFEFGDPNRPMATHRQFSIPDVPPKVQSGEMVIQATPTDASAGTDPNSGKVTNLFFDQDKNVTLNHESGNSFKMGADKTITTTHFAKKGTMKWNADGSVALNTMGADITTDAGSGTHTINAKSHTINGDINLKGNITQQGSITSTGSHTASELIGPTASA